MTNHTDDTCATCPSGLMNVIVNTVKKRFADEVGGLEEELLCDGKNHTVTVVFDAGVCAVYFVKDGVFCDGGEKRQFGFIRFDRNVSFEMGFDKQTENKLLNLRLCEGIHLYD